MSKASHALEFFDYFAGDKPDGFKNRLRKGKRHCSTGRKFGGPDTIVFLPNGADDK